MLRGIMKINALAFALAALAGSASARLEVKSKLSGLNDGRRLRIMKMSLNAKMGRYALDGAAAAHSAQIKAAEKLLL